MSALFMAPPQTERKKEGNIERERHETGRKKERKKKSKTKCTKREEEKEIGEAK
jgi:hypothetical protein